MSAFRLEADTPPRPGDVGFGLGADIQQTPVGRPRGRSTQELPSTKSGFFHPFEHKILRLLCAELSGERPGVKEWP